MLKVKANRLFTTSGEANPATWRHIPEDLNPQDVISEFSRTGGSYHCELVTGLPAVGIKFCDCQDLYLRVVDCITEKVLRNILNIIYFLTYLILFI
jgi:hypothetical protein